ncbi:MAG: hypothetical protein GVY36_08235 [Verrucomicrobia bacterium]|jgi:hypothetical protein|nr:hypothetical protein [Verrucomicrobiota bacterium]
MNKIYDKLLLVIALLILAGGVFLYLNASDNAEAVAAPANPEPAQNPYEPEPLPESNEADGNWPMANEQSSGWLYDVFTPPQIFIDADGQFSIVPITPPPPPVPFGVYLAEIRRNLYRLQLEGYIEESATDASKTLLLFVDEEDQRQVRARPGDVVSEHGFEVRGFTVERVQTEDGGIQKVATATIYDQRRDELLDLNHGEQRYDPGITVILRSEQDPSVEIELTDTPSDFQTPSGSYTLEEINLEDSFVTVKKHATEDRESETKKLFLTSTEPEDTVQPTPEIENSEDDNGDPTSAFDSLF